MPPAPSDIAALVVDLYPPPAAPAFVYGQGSVFTGFTADSDLDIVMVWDGDRVPEGGRRPVAELSDAGSAFRQHDLPGMALDNLHVAGRPVDVAHFPLRTFASWCGQVREGTGWQREEWPLPLHAVAGFVYGVDLADPRGLATSARAELAQVPRPLVERTRSGLADLRAGYTADLGAAARADNGWLFHSLLTPVLRTAYLAWFAAEGRYCPFPKHLHAWVERFAMDRDIADLDRQLWSAVTVAERHGAALDLVDRVLGLPVGDGCSRGHG